MTSSSSLLICAGKRGTGRRRLPFVVQGWQYPLAVAHCIVRVGLLDAAFAVRKLRGVCIVRKSA
jgi:hypothetical protein